jgi:uncharacterized membrane protein YkvA (DUF1232 family)
MLSWMPGWLLIAAGCTLVLYLAFILVLLLLGRRQDARAWAGFVPDCVVLFKRLLGDSRVSRGRKVLIGAVVAYLALPFDLVPDFIPVAGQLDDAIIVAVVLRAVLRGAGSGLVREHWPGPPASLAVMLRLAPARGPSTTLDRLD